MPLIEVKNRFLKDVSKQAELEVVLSAQDCQQTEPGVIVYGGGMDFVDAVRVRFSKKGKISSIKCHAGSVKRLEKKIDDAIYTDHGKVVGRQIIFTNIKISEQFRLNDDFQIIPTPPGSPEINGINGDHPAILEFSFNRSPHNIVDIRRRTGRANELACLLSAFVFHGINWSGSHYEAYWVSGKPEGEKRTVEYRQKFYNCGDWEQKDSIGFSVLDKTSQIPLMEPSAYFGQLGISVGSGFKLPSTIATYCRKYEALSQDEKKMAHLSAHWLQKSSVIHNASVSLSFSAIVFALESLIHPPKQTGKCRNCEKVLYESSISQCFRDLIETYARGISKNDVNDIYAIRSKIAHGSGLMGHDQNVGFRFSDPLIRSQTLYEQARGLCQVVFINWLMSRE